MLHGEDDVAAASGDAAAALWRLPSERLRWYRRGRGVVLGCDEGGGKALPPRGLRTVALRPEERRGRARRRRRGGRLVGSVGVADLSEGPGAGRGPNPHRFDDDLFLSKTRWPTHAGSWGVVVVCGLVGSVRPSVRSWRAVGFGGVVVDGRARRMGGGGAGSGRKVLTLVASMLVGSRPAASCGVVRAAAGERREGGVPFDGGAPSTAGSFLRSFTFGHVRQLDSAAELTRPGVVSIGACARRWRR